MTATPHRAQAWTFEVSRQGTAYVTSEDGTSIATCHPEYAPMIAASPMLYDALEAVHDWRGLCDDDSIETFERIAVMFHKDTGMLRPGKDQAAAFGCYPTDEERHAALDAWVTRKNDELNAKIRTAFAAARGGA